MMLMSSILLPTMWLESPQEGAFSLTVLLVMGLTITGVFATGAFAVQVWAQRLVPAQRVALIFSLEPAYAAWLAWYFLGEQMNARGLLGSAIILAAVIIGAIAPEVEKVAESVESPAAS
jgi:drug/metabolite transporter (DMT)-like permease